MSSGPVGRPPRVVMAILAHGHPSSLADLVANLRFFCPEAELLLYNSGDDPDLGRDLNLELFPAPVRLRYSKVTHFFLDVFELLHRTGRDYDYLVNLETDMLFLRHGFEVFLSRVMQHHAYMAPLFAQKTPAASRWRPIRTLRPELPKWYELLGFQYTNRGFSPGQVFTRTYIDSLVGHAAYPDIVSLVRGNRSNSLQEVLFPTLADFLQLPGRGYPESPVSYNRYRPYQAVCGVQRALAHPDAYFVHPVRRNEVDPARQHLLSLMSRSGDLPANGSRTKPQMSNPTTR